MIDFDSDAFLFDNVVEREPSENDDRDTSFLLQISLLYMIWRSIIDNRFLLLQQFWLQNGKPGGSPKEGRERVQARMMIQLASTDAACTKRVKHVWKEMINTTLRDKDTHFDRLDAYVDFRIVDTGAP